MNITGLDEFQRKLNDTARALESLNGTITTLNFNTDDPNSVEEAIRQMETAIDSKIAPYGDNSLISGLAQEMKENFRQQILEKAKAEQK